MRERRRFSDHSGSASVGLASCPLGRGTSGPSSARSVTCAGRDDDDDAWTNQTDPAESAETFDRLTPGDPIPTPGNSAPAQSAPRLNPDSAAETQRQLSDEIEAIETAYRASGVVETQPRLNYPPYRSSVLRHPTKDLRHADPETIELGRRASASGMCTPWSRI